MASRDDRIETRRSAPRLYLVTPVVTDPGGLADALAQALGAGDVAAVLIRLAAADDRTLINHVKALAGKAHFETDLPACKGLPESEVQRFAQQVQQGR